MCTSTITKLRRTSVNVLLFLLVASLAVFAGSRGEIHGVAVSPRWQNHSGCLHERQNRLNLDDFGGDGHCVTIDRLEDGEGIISGIFGGRQAFCILIRLRANRPANHRHERRLLTESGACGDATLNVLAYIRL